MNARFIIRTLSVLTSLGTSMCASASEKLLPSEMNTTLGAFPGENPLQANTGTKVNSICTDGPEVCTAGISVSGASQCVFKRPMPYRTCSGTQHEGQTCQWSGNFVLTCLQQRWTTSSRKWVWIPFVGYQIVPNCQTGDSSSLWEDDRDDSGCI